MFKHEDTITLHPSRITLDELRMKASGLHFCQEMLSSGERDILRLLESALYLIDSDAVTVDATKL